MHVFQPQPQSSRGHIALRHGFNPVGFFVGDWVAEQKVRGRGSLSTTDNGRDITVTKEGETEPEVKFGIGDRSQTETGGGRIVQMRADIGEVGERHCA